MAKTPSRSDLDEDYHERTVIRLAVETPKFLRREVTAEGRARVDGVIRQDHGDLRSWIMPDLSKYNTGDGEMAKKKAAEPSPDGELSIECVDTDLPVEVEIQLAGSRKTAEQQFIDMQGFMDWFDQDRHELIGSIARDDKTMISVRERRPAAKEPEPVKEEAEVDRGAVVKEAPSKGKGKKGKAPVEPAKPKKYVAKRAPNNASVRHSCVVNGKSYPSVYKAFVALGLPVDAHQKFRAGLKKTAKLKDTFTHKGKKYNFELREMTK